MKNIIFLFLMLISLFSLAQKEAIHKEIWHSDFQDALNVAKDKNLPLILVFSGSDWCKPCIMLKSDIFESEEFKAFAKDSLVMVLADFPRSKKNQLNPEQKDKNEALAEKYNTQGAFPHVVIFNPKGEVIATTGYLNITPAEYIQHIQSFLNK